MWMSFNSIADSTAKYFDINQMQVNWLSIVFMVATLAVGIGAIWIMDNWGLRTAVILSFLFHRLECKNVKPFHVMNSLVALNCRTTQPGLCFENSLNYYVP